MDRTELKHQIKKYFKDHPKSNNYSGTHKGVSYSAQRNGKQIKIRQHTSGSFQIGGSSSEFMGKLSQLKTFLDNADTHAHKFYDANNKAAASKTRKSLGEIQKLAKELRKLIQADKSATKSGGKSNKSNKHKNEDDDSSAENEPTKKKPTDDDDDDDVISDKVSSFGVSDNDGDYGYY